MSDYLITDTNDIALITINNIPNNVFYISKIFNMISNENINVDMIMKSLSFKKLINLSFTINESSINNLINTIKKIKVFIPEITTEISNGNSKITIHKKYTGDISFIVSKIFNIASNMKINIGLITTSENEISLLLSSEHTKMFKDELTVLLKKDIYNDAL